MTTKKSYNPFTYLALGLVKFYRLGISPFLAPSCRFYPTCSTYALKALKTHGFLKAILLIAFRILRCNPWNEGGYDPVPEKKIAKN